MKQLFPFLMIIPIIFSCKKDEEPQTGIPDSPVAGILDGEEFIPTAIKANYLIPPGSLKKELLQLVFQSEVDSTFNICSTSHAHLRSPYIHVVFRPRLGQQRAGGVIRNTGAFVGNTGQASTTLVDIYIEEMDTIGIGWIKGRIRYVNDDRGSRGDSITGAFSIPFCRHWSEIQFVNKPIEANVMGTTFGIVDGVAIGECGNVNDNTINFFFTQKNVTDCNEDFYGITRFTVFFSDTIKRGYYHTVDFPWLDIDIAYRDTAANTYFPTIQGGLEVLRIDRSTKSLKGRIDAFAVGGNYLDLSGDFEIKYIE